MKWRHLIPIFFCTVSPIFINAQSPQKQGSIHPNAIKIDFDDCSPFKEGYAVITKGVAQALIDKQGNFLVPYGKYKYPNGNELYPGGNVYPEGFVNGLCRVEIKRETIQSYYGFIDKTGKLIVPCIYENATPFNDDGYAYVQKTQKQISDPRYVVIDRKGKETRLAEFGQLYYNKSTARMMSTKGIVDHTLKLIQPIQFDGVSEFHQGLCAVAKRNEFGDLKWGFVNTNGEMIIPLMFSKQPEDFKNGLVKVFPPNQNEFDYAYLDRNGEFKIIVKGIKIMAEGGGTILTKLDKTFRTAGFIELNNTVFLFDSLGNIFNFGEALLKNGAPYKIKTVSYRYASVNSTEVIYAANSGLGIAKLDGTIVLEPLFYLSLSHFDPVSGLARAEVQIPNSADMLKGYVNEDGMFVIVKKEASKW